MVVSKDLGDMIANQHLDNHVKMYLTSIWVAGSQSNMETHACKYGSSISFLFM